MDITVQQEAQLQEQDIQAEQDAVDITVPETQLEPVVQVEQDVVDITVQQEAQLQEQDAQVAYVIQIFEIVDLALVYVQVELQEQLLVLIAHLQEQHEIPEQLDQSDHIHHEVLVHHLMVVQEAVALTQEVVLLQAIHQAEVVEEDNMLKTLY